MRVNSMKICFPNVLWRAQDVLARPALHQCDPQALSTTSFGNPLLPRHRVPRFDLPARPSYCREVRVRSRCKRGPGFDWRSQPRWNSRTRSSFPDGEISLDENLPWCFKQTALHREASTRSRGFRLTATCTSNPSSPQGTIGPTKGLATERARLYACRAPTMSRWPFT